MEKLLKLRQAANLIGHHRETLKRWIKSGCGPKVSITPSGRYLFTESDLIAWHHSLKVFEPVTGAE
jgi:predicted site-specific integrase-resolvase